MSTTQTLLASIPASSPANAAARDAYLEMFDTDADAFAHTEECLEGAHLPQVAKDVLDGALCETYGPEAQVAEYYAWLSEEATLAGW